MTLTKQEWKTLEDKAHSLRKLILDTTRCAGGGHIGGCLSIIDIMTALYYKEMHFDPKKYDDPDRDRCIVSKGHAGIATACLFSDLGLIDPAELKSYNKTGSRLNVHLDSKKIPGLDASTGSLGHGSAMALGMALAAKMSNRSYKTYVLLGDGECDEGSVWESAMATAHFKATNLITIVDRNYNMIDGKTEDVMSLEPFADKWAAFGFDVKVIDGHDFRQICDAIEYAKLAQDKPVVIIANTVKGNGISYMAGNYKWHHGSIDEEKYTIGMNDLEKYHQEKLALIEKEGK
ncbi:MAG: transketolase [Clostridia bacterium]|nr:transketolase [Clostridia bacterium]